MASIIKILDETVINRIAAGEVIERPASVVKELVENSIDAKSTYISVEIENGGKKLIRVRDNGIGMSNDDAFLAIERHATSKIRSDKDLAGVSTMGFRGEALASIASISRFRLITKDEHESEGMDLFIEGGTLKRADKIGAGRGTTIEVRNLFFNAPVRAKYLKGKALESGYIHELVLKIALANISVGFKYSEDGRVKIESPPVRSILDRINNVFSKEVRENLTEVDWEFEKRRVYGFVAKPPYARSTMRSILTFVNKRPVKDRLVNSALNRAFSGLMERGRYPVAVLFIEVAPDEVDVNVHPQKSEVRFVHPSKVSDLIYTGVSQCLYESPYRSIGNVTVFRDKLAETGQVSKPVLFNEQTEKTPESVMSDVPISKSYPDELNLIGQRRETQDMRYSDLSILGRIPGSFIVLHDEKELVFLDHHAAHERIVFDELMKAHVNEKVVESQNLLIPRVISLTPVEASSLRVCKDMLATSGIIVEDFGAGDFVVKACPDWINNHEIEDILRELAWKTADFGTKSNDEQLVVELFKTISCKTAVKETTQLHNDEIKALLQSLDDNQSPRVCPHGRPLSLRMPISEIKRRLGRNPT